MPVKLSEAQAHAQTQARLIQQVPICITQRLKQVRAMQEEMDGDNDVIHAASAAWLDARLPAIRQRCAGDTLPAKLCLLIDFGIVKQSQTLSSMRNKDLT